MLSKTVAIVLGVVMSGMVAFKVNANDGKAVFFGDLHVHTRYSLDAITFGTFSGPADAYRFAMGYPLKMLNGSWYQLDRPLDFLSVTEHAFGLGEYALCVEQTTSAAWQMEVCRELRSGKGPGGIQPFLAGRGKVPPARNAAVCGDDGTACVDAAVGPWQAIQADAAAFNNPGKFTTFIGFEWTPADRFRRTVHRNIIFRNDKVTARAMSVFEYPLIADFWGWLDSACTGECEALVIPHNSNFSGGLMFSPTDEVGDEFTVEDWERRARFEKLVEIYQVKGASECMVGFGVTDEECNFEQFLPACGAESNGRCASPPGFAREGLLIGLGKIAELGFNPMQFGFIGSTDTHTSAGGAVSESRYPGHHSGLDQTPEAALTGKIAGGQSIYKFTPGGLAAIWATENTREALFAAMKRRETYATSGTRIKLRFSANGQPMGSVVTSKPAFRVVAERDVLSAPLHKLQIIKGWVDQSGVAQESVADIACAVGEPDNGVCPPQPSDLDVAACNLPREGSARIVADWQDPRFDATLDAFYYVRAIEAPVCRWTTVIARHLGQPPPADVPATIQERAWSSPIWYTALQSRP